MAIKSNKQGKSFDFDSMQKVDIKDFIGKQITVYYKKKIKSKYGYTWLLILDEKESIYTYAPSANVDDLEDGFDNEDCPVTCDVTERTAEKSGNKYLKLYW